MTIPASKKCKPGIWELMQAAGRIRSSGCPLGLELESRENRRRRFKASKKSRGR